MMNPGKASIAYQLITCFRAIMRRFGIKDITGLANKQWWKVYNDAVEGDVRWDS